MSILPHAVRLASHPTEPTIAYACPVYGDPTDRTLPPGTLLEVPARRSFIDEPFHGIAPKVMPRMVPIDDGAASTRLLGVLVYALAGFAVGWLLLGSASVVTSVLDAFR